MVDSKRAGLARRGAATTLRLIEPPQTSTLFLLSPANLSGKRGKQLLAPDAGFELARRLRSPEGAPLDEVFSFVSSLYFRGKVSYARAFGTELPPALVITAGGGLCLPDERVTLSRLRDWANVSVQYDNPHFTAPLLRHATELLQRVGQSTRFVLLGSVASRKYVVPLLDVLGDRLFFPTSFASLGDMSRGSMMLRAVRDRRELAYQPLGASPSEPSTHL
jgi:hypothetical protein